MDDARDCQQAFVVGDETRRVLQSDFIDFGDVRLRLLFTLLMDLFRDTADRMIHVFISIIAVQNCTV